MEIKFAENLKKLRNESNLTQKKLADQLHLTQRKISYLEGGSIEPDLATIVAIAAFFEVSCDYLLLGKL